MICAPSYGMEMSYDDYKLFTSVNSPVVWRTLLWIAFLNMANQSLQSFANGILPVEENFS